MSASLNVHDRPRLRGVPYLLDDIESEDMEHLRLLNLSKQKKHTKTSTNRRKKSRNPVTPRKAKSSSSKPRLVPHSSTSDGNSNNSEPSAGNKRPNILRKKKPSAKKKKFTSIQGTELEGMTQVQLSYWIHAKDKGSYSLEQLQSRELPELVSTALKLLNALNAVCDSEPASVKTMKGLTEKQISSRKALFTQYKSVFRFREEIVDAVAVITSNPAPKSPLPSVTQLQEFYDNLIAKEDAINCNISYLKRVIESESYGIVRRGQASAELAQLQSVNTTLSSDIINARTSLKRATNSQNPVIVPLVDEGLPKEDWEESVDITLQLLDEIIVEEDNSESSHFDVETESEAETESESTLKGGTVKFGVEELPQSDPNAFISFVLKKCGLIDDTMQHIIDMSSCRLQDRNEAREAFNTQISRDKGRGRKRNTSNLSEEQQKKQIHNDKSYESFCSKKLTKNELLDYISICLFGGIVKKSNLKAYFKPNKAGGAYEPLDIGLFGNARMSYQRFVFISSIIDYDVDFIIDKMESSIQDAYLHTDELAPDESMNPLKIRNMVHHFFLMCKPHPNGILSTSVADKNLITIALRMRRRVKEDICKPALRRMKIPEPSRTTYQPSDKKGTTELIMETFDRVDITQVTPFIAVDSLYGSLDLLTKAHAAGVGGI